MLRRCCVAQKGADHDHPRDQIACEAIERARDIGSDIRFKIQSRCLEARNDRASGCMSPGTGVLDGAIEAIVGVEGRNDGPSERKECGPMCQMTIHAGHDRGVARSKVVHLHDQHRHFRR